MAPHGALTRSQSFDVFGRVRTSQGTGASQHRFVGSLGHPSDDGTGLIYMRARWKDPVTGRFVSEDPACRGTNWFVYCGNDPVNRIDRNGREDCWERIVVDMVSTWLFNWGVASQVPIPQLERIVQFVLSAKQLREAVGFLNDLIKLLGDVSTMDPDAARVQHQLIAAQGLTTLVLFAITVYQGYLAVVGILDPDSLYQDGTA